MFVTKSFFFILVLICLSSAQMVYTDILYSDEASCDSQTASMEMGQIYYRLGVCYEFLIPGGGQPSCQDTTDLCFSDGPIEYTQYMACTNKNTSNIVPLHIIFYRNGDYFERRTFTGKNSTCNSTSEMYGSQLMGSGIDYPCGSSIQCYRSRSSQPQKLFSNFYTDSTETCGPARNVSESFYQMEEECYQVRNYITPPSCDRVHQCLNGSELSTYQNCLNTSHTLTGSYRIFRNGTEYLRKSYTSLDCSGVPTLTPNPDSCSQAQFPDLNHPSCGFQRSQRTPSYLQALIPGESSNPPIAEAVGGTLAGIFVILGLILTGSVVLICLVAIVGVILLGIVILVVGAGLIASGSSIGVMKLKSKEAPAQLDFTLGKKIGEGSFGQVFQATSAGEQIAVKRLLLDDMSSESFTRELELFQELGRSFPYIVKFLGVTLDEVNRLAYLKMELCDGPLSKVLPSMNLNQKLSLMAKIASALGLLHSKNIIHRDLALRNILIRDGQPKLSDFGMSRKLDQEDSGKTVTSTIPIRWTAPESMKKDQGQLSFTKASDIFSLGMTFYEILTERMPFWEVSALEAGRKIQQGFIPELPYLIPEQFQQLYRSCLSFNPEDRPSAGDLAKQLQGLTSISLDLGEYVAFTG